MRVRLRLKDVCQDTSGARARARVCVRVCACMFDQQAAAAALLAQPAAGARRRRAREVHSLGLRRTMVKLRDNGQTPG